MSAVRILTVRQPWAWAIIHGGKDVENRVRNLAGDYRGPVLIHAGLKPERPGYAWGVADAAGMNTDRYDGDPLHLGHIIGVVDLTDVHHAAECVYVGPAIEDFDGNFVSQEIACCTSWAESENVYHLALANPRALDEPIPYKGALGLRKTNFGIAGDWMYEETDRCTCGVGTSIGALYGHEPGCGMEPVARLMVTS